MVPHSLIFDPKLTSAELGVLIRILACEEVKDYSYLDFIAVEEDDYNKIVNHLFLNNYITIEENK